MFPTLDYLSDCESALKCSRQQVGVLGRAKYFSYTLTWVFSLSQEHSFSQNLNYNHVNKVRHRGESPHLSPSDESASLTGQNGNKDCGGGGLPFLLSRSHNAELLWCRWPPEGRQRPDTGTTCGSATVHHTGLLTTAALSLLIEGLCNQAVCDGAHA